MKNWNTDTSRFPQRSRAWELAQMVMYGCDDKKIPLGELKEYWNEIRDRIDPESRRQFEVVVWNKKYSLPRQKQFFWQQNDIKVLPIDTTSLAEQR